MFCANLESGQECPDYHGKISNETANTTDSRDIPVPTIPGQKLYAWGVVECAASANRVRKPSSGKQRRTIVQKLTQNHLALYS